MSVRVFVSSTSQDLKDHREAVRDVIRKLGALDISMEVLGARDERPKAECVRLLREDADLFVGIYAYRYGYLPPGDSVSIAETEYLVACERQMPRFIFLVDESAPWIPGQIERGDGESRLAAFKNRLKANHVCEFFSDADDLAKRVAASLGRHLWLQKIKRVEPDGGLSTESKPVSPSLPTAEDWRTLRDEMYVQSKGFFLVHTLSPSNEPGQLFSVRIYLFRHKSDDFAPVKAADFFFGKYWKNQIFHVDNEGGPIGITTAAYGPFLCVCKVYFVDGTECVTSRYIDFESGHFAR